MASHDHHDVGSSDAPSRISAQEGRLSIEGLTIDRAGEIPIGVQLAWALRARIGDGRLTPGRRLPGLRELADMLGINANTARAVYQRLEQEGLIDSRQGTGTFVASVTPEPSAVGQIAADAARQARRTGVDPREVAAALYVTPEPPADPAAHGATQDAERRRELRAQIAALEQALSEIQARNPGLVPAPTRSLMRAGPRLLSVEELQRVRTQLVRRLAAAEPLLEPPAEAKQAAASAKKLQSATERVTDSKQAKQAPRPRPSTRPSTA
ncbi:MAG: GntR family transcriptional regulator [Solirubrobacteraceae bacterium]